SAKPGQRNGAYCAGLEHKMGIHGNATAQIVLDNAVGTLVGQPNKGLAAMFVMMNAARLGVGNQSLGLTEVAYQNAVAYAKDRIQMRALSGPKAPDKPADPIIVHPDVRKMLLTARAYAEGGRALAIYTALQIDQELSSTDEDERKAAADQVALLTPIIKAFITDNAWAATSHCMQVFGGHGYIAEWGMEQYVRVAGHLVFAYFWARMAKVALAKKDSGDPFYTAKLNTARFYFAKLLPETAGLIRSARAGLHPLMAMDEALF